MLGAIYFRRRCWWPSLSRVLEMGKAHAPELEEEESGVGKSSATEVAALPLCLPGDIDQSFFVMRGRCSLMHT